MEQFTKRWLIPVLLGVSSFALDFWSKTWVRANLDYGQSQTFIPGFLNLLRTVNTGGAFGIGRGNGIVMTILASAIVIAIIAWAWKREKSGNGLAGVERCGVGVIVGAAMGNLWDRFTQREVTDFLEFAFIQFPVFNVADALIDVGAGLIIIGALFYSKTPEKQADGDCCGRDHHSEG
ncbi:MAG: signal peptidase II [Candidatus Obscuribacterales bacterium]|jgi:signal peptidase II|nr:signal peptidase II [Candidatus Obscuribacterales bacterium]